MEALEAALTSNRPAIERELVHAEDELRELRVRARTLESLIDRGRYVLGIVPTPAGRARPTIIGFPDGDGDLSLHEALARILRDGGNAPMTARELADGINDSGLYRKRDGSPVDPGQIHARVHVYSRLFLRDGGRIRLRDAELRTYDAHLLEQFNEAMLGVYASALREVRYAARRFLIMTNRRGGHEAARHLLSKPGVSEGFRRLAEANKLMVTMEFQVLRPEFRPLFSDDERATAKRRLLEFGLREEDLP
ncbi:MAG: hypothetical protein H0V73_04590 [Chloroflexi bacterium]|nr:hypothetical protein [Chloroflexota bacterium]